MLPLPLKGQRTHAVIAFEKYGKIAGGGKAHPLGYVGNAHTAGKQTCRFVGAELGIVGLGADVGVLLKEQLDIAYADITVVGKIRKR